MIFIKDYRGDRWSIKPIEISEWWGQAGCSLIIGELIFIEYLERDAALEIRTLLNRIIFDCEKKNNYTSITKETIYKDGRTSGIAFVCSSENGIERHEYINRFMYVNCRRKNRSLEDNMHFDF